MAKIRPAARPLKEVFMLSTWPRTPGLSSRETGSLALYSVNDRTHLVAGPSEVGAVHVHQDVEEVRRML